MFLHFLWNALQILPVEKLLRFVDISNLKGSASLAITGYKQSNWTVLLPDFLNSSSTWCRKKMSKHWASSVFCVFMSVCVFLYPVAGNLSEFGLHGQWGRESVSFEILLRLATLPSWFSWLVVFWLVIHWFPHFLSTFWRLKVVKKSVTRKRNKQSIPELVKIKTSDDESPELSFYNISFD